jgi:hypothetical protein
MNAQDEIERLKREVEQLRKALCERQQLSAPNLPSLRDNYEFVLDCARYSEGLATEAAVRKKYHFDESTWESLGKDDALVERIEAEKVRRVRDGSAKRERAQQHIVKGPDILNGIMTDPKASPRHKVDAIKTLDALADPGPQAAADQERVVVTINLGGGDVFRYSGSVKPIPSDDAKKLIEHDDSTPGVPGFAV